jgi:hypothetical protein
LTPTVSQWYGRFGNNIQQVSNALYYCSLKRANYYPLHHSIIKTSPVFFGEGIVSSNRFFFYNTDEKDFDCNIDDLNAQRRNICLEYISDSLNLPNHEPMGEDTVVLHIRAGDIFSSRPPNTYVQNPLSYYESILQQFEEAIIVSDRGDNPIIKELARHPKVRIQGGSLHEDLATLMSAKHIASSGVGTFAVAVALCSKNIKSFIHTDLYLNEHLNPTMLTDTDIQLKKIDLQDGYIKIGEWKNSELQRKMLLSW